MGTGGAYVISTDNPELRGMIGMANATAGTVSPYQERPQQFPLEFRVRFDPSRDRGLVFPLLCEVARPGESTSAMKERMVQTAERLPQIYEQTKELYTHFFDNRVVVHTPDASFDSALAWAELSIEKAKVTTPEGESGLVAGWYPSFDSARPGFGWFFGRDTLWSLYAIDSYGDAALAREALEFLIRRQRADGKMMHEYSQTAALLTGTMAWSNFPYEYAAADSTPLYLLAMQDYVRTTGDIGFLRAHWESVKLAYHFERTHDSDGDGVYDNSQGTGWVEGWPPKLPHQELYLAALDRDATAAMSQLAGWMGDADLQEQAHSTAARLAGSVEAYRQANGTYAFSKNADGSYDPTMTIYPAVALWQTGAGMPKAQVMLTDWASHEFATDWGTRAIDEKDPVYDPISYHQGSVWPLFTGWTAMAEYRSGRPLAGFASLERNVNLTWAQDPGAVTEVLSGRFYQPLGRSSTHQLWSSAMTFAPALRGLFGIEADAPDHLLLVHPQLPASWDKSAVDHVLVGDVLYDVSFARSDGRLLVTASSDRATVLCLRSAVDLSGAAPCRDAASREHRLAIALPAVELELGPMALPVPGADTRQPRIVDEQYAPGDATVVVEGEAGSIVELKLQRNRAVTPVVEGGSLSGDRVVVKMPAGNGFVRTNLKVSW
jgi:glycogen debranching enzyme